MSQHALDGNLKPGTCTRAITFGPILVLGCASNTVTHNLKGHNFRAPFKLQFQAHPLSVHLQVMQCGAVYMNTCGHPAGQLHVVKVSGADTQHR